MVATPLGTISGAWSQSLSVQNINVFGAERSICSFETPQVVAESGRNSLISSVSDLQTKNALFSDTNETNSETCTQKAELGSGQSAVDLGLISLLKNY